MRQGMHPFPVARLNRLSYERAEYLFKRATGHTLRTLRAGG
jgi:hypothetical protein